MQFSPLLTKLIEDLQILPGVGPKSAQRMAFHLLEKARIGAASLSSSISEALERVGHCQRCRTFSEAEVCSLCQSAKRQQSGVLCIVESPADIAAIEQTGQYQGLYFVLMGHLSPLDGIGPEEIGLDLLEQRLAQGGITELILATNPTVEGEATAHYISDIAQRLGVNATRIAHGIPVGGSLEYIDGQTLAHSFSGRRPL